MALTVIKGQGLIYPLDIYMNLPSQFGQALDAADEQIAFIGHIYIDGRPTAAKTFSAAGGGSISIRNGTCTFANAGTSVLVGIQDVTAGAGPPVRPDETFDVESAALVGGGGAFVTNTYTTISMTGGSGSKSITHGDLIAVVVNMTARGGADSVSINANGGVPNALLGRPLTAVKIAGAWSVHGGHPNVLITFDDGTIATLDGSLPFNSGTTESFSAATNPDERGLLFQVPWEVKIDGFWAACNGTAAGSDFTMKLYSDPTGTPVELHTQDFLGERFTTANAARPFLFLVPTQITLSKDTNYGLVAIATGASTIGLFTTVLGNEAHRVLYTGGTTLAKITRNDGTGAFAAESPAITRPMMGISISQFHDGAGAGGAGGGSVFGSKGGVIA